MPVIKIIVKSCNDCPFKQTRWHGKQPTYYCTNMPTDEEHCNFGREIPNINVLDSKCNLREEEVWNIQKDRI